MSKKSLHSGGNSDQPTIVIPDSDHFVFAYTDKLQTIDAVRENLIRLHPGAKIVIREGTLFQINIEVTKEEKLRKWISDYLREEGFSEKHLRALMTIINKMNESAESNKEVMDFAKRLNPETYS